MVTEQHNLFKWLSGMAVWPVSTLWVSLAAVYSLCIRILFWFHIFLTQTAVCTCVNTCWQTSEVKPFPDIYDQLHCWNMSNSLLLHKTGDFKPIYKCTAQLWEYPSDFFMRCKSDSGTLHMSLSEDKTERQPLDSCTHYLAWHTRSWSHIQYIHTHKDKLPPGTLS